MTASPDTSQFDSPQFDSPQSDSPQFDSPQFDSPQSDSPQSDAAQFGLLSVEAAQSATTELSGAPRLLRRTELLAQGLSDNHIRRAVRESALAVVSPGVYLREGEAQALDAAARHRAAVDALVPRLSGEPVVSHISAAIVHGLPFVHSELPPVHITRAGGRKSRRGGGLLAHRAALRPDEVVTLGGLAVTTVARTIVDCALLLPFGNAVVLTDAALHRRQVSRAALAEQVRGHARVPGVRAAAAVVEFADGRSLGAGESFSRVLLAWAGLPPPDLRVRVCDRDGEPVGSASFGYVRQRVLGEFDGGPVTTERAGGGDDRQRDDRQRAEPQGDDRQCDDRQCDDRQCDDRQCDELQRGHPQRDYLQRDERLRAAGWRVVRWTWDDLRSPAALAGRLAVALGVPVPALLDNPAGSLLGDGDLHLRGI